MPRKRLTKADINELPPGKPAKQGLAPLTADGRDIHSLETITIAKLQLKTLRRLYREKTRQIHTHGGRKRALGTRRPMLVPEQTCARWSLDFVSDAFTDGRRFRVLAIVDDVGRECVVLIAETSLSGGRVTRDVTAIMARRGRPKTIVTDNGAELTRMAALGGCQDTRVDGQHISPGKHMQNAFAECFNGSFRDALLNETWFSSLTEAREKIAAWHDDNNRHRPRSSLGSLTPQELALKSRLDTKAARGQHPTDGSAQMPEGSRGSG